MAGPRDSGRVSETTAAPSTRTVIHSDQAPAAVGAYSQAIVAQGARTLYTSGQIALDPATGAMVGEGDVEAEARQVMKNLKAVVEAADMSLRDVVRCTIYLTDMADFARVNAIYAESFPADQNPPARACVAVAALPKGAVVEIDCVAVGG